MKNGNEFSREQGFFCDGFTYLGTGLPGGKASGLAQTQEILNKHFSTGNISGMKVNIPATTVLLSDVFDDFMNNNNLYDFALSDASDEDIAIRFIDSSFGGIYAGDLYYLVENIKTPLAVRSSSICEDSLNEPFAGIYETKMVANNQLSHTEKYNALINAIKFVYASLFFRQSKEYFRSMNKDIKAEKMAVIIQEVVGDQYDNFFHPAISGVIKSYNFYPSDNFEPEAGFAALAFGLGKTIVEGNSCWSYCPKFPRLPRPFNNLKDLLENTQKNYWTINLGKIENHNPIAESEYLLQNSIFDIKEDFPLNYISSTYDYQNDRLIMGRLNYGTPVLDFAPILRAEMLPLNSIVNQLLKACETETNTKVEIEFAVSMGTKKNLNPRFGLLQLRPINVSSQIVELSELTAKTEALVLATKNAMGNGIDREITDIVFIRPENFSLNMTRQIANDIAEINSLFLKHKRHYLLIGFGRWGTSDPWCGIPVKWPQISQAKAIVETDLPSIKADFSQGAHFFHNMTAHNVFYFSVNEEEAKSLDWEWITKQKIINETRYVKHVRVTSGITIAVDGRKSKGMILRNEV